MAKLKRARPAGVDLPQKPAALKVSNPAPHRQLSLLAITIILNTLLWSSVLCSVAALFQIVSDTDGGSNIPPGVLTLVSVSNMVRYPGLCTDHL